MKLTRPLLFVVIACAIAWLHFDARLASVAPTSNLDPDSALTGTAPQSGCAYSSLWGEAGEKWNPAGRLPDFSYSGYHAGEAKIPSPRARWNLKRDFHAVGDGHADDTQALLK